MKFSHYNHVFKNKDEYVLYNSVSNGMVSLTNDEYTAVMNVLPNKENISILEDSMIENLQELGIILDDYEDEKLSIFLDIMRARLDNRNLSLTIAPTLMCNFKCPYCYENEVKNNTDIITDEMCNYLIEFIETRIKNVDSLHIVWYGGEPLIALNKIELLSKRIIKLCNENNVFYTSSITTNGYLLNKKNLQLLYSLGVNNIQIPLDGSKNKHNLTRKTKNGAGSFDKIISNLKSIQYEEYKNLPNINLRVNVTRENSGSIDELVEYLRGEGILNYCTYYLAKIDDYEDKECINILTKSEFNELEEKHQKKSLNYEDFLYPKRLYMSSGCENQCSLVIDPHGNIYKCWEDIGKKNGVVYNIRNNEVDVSKKATVENKRNLVFNPFDVKKCNDCKILPNCMLGNCPKYRDINISDDCEGIVRKFDNNIIEYLELNGVKGAEKIY